jgi:two-component system, OmpR family, phosphate regulon sensor histidine kinase PhoR
LAERNYLWKVYYPYFLFILVALIAFGIYASGIYSDFFYSKIIESLESDARLISLNLQKSEFDSLDASSLNTYDKQTGARITLIEPSGNVIADTRENAREMELHNTRPEFMDALKGKTGFDKRYSHTKQMYYIYIAVPVYSSEGIVKGALRTSIPQSEIENQYSPVYYAVIMGGLGVLVVLSLIALFAARKTISPLIELKQAAERFSVGDFSEKIYPPKNKELRKFAESLNLMAEQLDEKLNIIGEQKNLQRAVLESMKEGVLAIDYDEKVLLINKTAEEILSVVTKEAAGKTIQEICRISEIHKFFRKVINDGDSQDAEIVIQHEKDKILQLSGTVLHDIDDNKMGALVVLNDITNLKHLDNLKRDLVANVSHELKTPITTIKGFIELLREGEIDDPKNAHRFLEIISRHTDRLNAIVEDLLTLSRLEQSGVIKELKFNEHQIKPLLKSVAEDYEFKARDKHIKIDINGDDSLAANFNKPLIEQAVGNLLDNAIKYSDKKSNVILNSYKENGNLVIEVEDEGWGIAKENIPRLFERFYRIEKSRSRDEGGTGLGLAIVKHIVQVHGGTIEVKSEPNKGSVFIIKIPSKHEENIPAFA